MVNFHNAAVSYIAVLVWFWYVW